MQPSPRRPTAPPQPVVLVTGARRGIGAACAQALAAPGATIIVHHLDAYEQAAKVTTICQDAGAESYAIDADLGDPREVERLCLRIAAESGGVDILINNAARPSNASVKDVTLAEWTETLQINLTAPLLVTQGFLPHMRAQRWGRIINITSAAVRLGGPSGLAYVASKAGLLGMTRSLARQLGPEWVTVNAVSPGAVLTEQERELYPEESLQEGDRRIIGLQAIPSRLGPHDLAPLIQYLSSPAAWCVTGQNYEVNGGWFFD